MFETMLAAAIDADRLREAESLRARSQALRTKSTRQYRRARWSGRLRLNMWVFAGR